MAAITTKPEVLETPRLRLFEVTPAMYLQLVNTGSDAEIKAYLGLKTKEEVAQEREKAAKGVTSYFTTFKNFRLLHRESGRVIGGCDFHTWHPTHRRAEIGYHLKCDSDKSKGLMTEALGAVLVYGFEKMDLQRIEALIAADNEPSRRLLEHFGFSKEGVIRMHYNVNGVNEDSMLYSLIRPDYDRLNASWAAPAAYS